MPSQLQIFFFSGTGNAKNVAQWIGEKAKERLFSIEINDLSKIDRKNIKHPDANALVGFISPTHGFNFPPVMMYFIFRFPKANICNNVFIINTRAGIKIGKLFVPGLSGIALWLAAIVLIIKGYKISGLRSIDLPSNWISLHPSLKENAVVQIYEHCKRITANFAGDILSGRKNFHAGFDIIQDILIAPISIGYFLVGRFIFAKSFYAGSLCSKCNTCIRNCPVGAIKLVNDQPFWTYSCESCMKCMNECPNRAIETGHGYIIGLLVLINSLILLQFWQFIFNQIQFNSHSLIFELIKFIVDSGLTLVLLLVSYRTIHSLKRLPVIKQLVEYTSLTRYDFWGRYNIKKIFRAEKRI